MVSCPKDSIGPIPFHTGLLISGLEEIGHKVNRLSLWGSRKSDESFLFRVFQRTRAIRTIIRETRKQNYDFIYLHSSLDMRALLRDVPLLTVLRISRIPTVIIFHGSELEPLKSNKNWIFFLGTEILLRLVSGVLVESSEEQRTLVNIWPWVKCAKVLKPIKAPPISAGVLDEQMGDDRLPTLIFAGRFIQEKGVLDILEALPLVLDKLDCRCIFAGGGLLLKDMQKHAEENDLHELVEFKGYLDRKAMWKTYRQADILLLPTYHPEGMPTVALEAIACGLGIICSQIRGLKDYFREGENAFFVPAKNPQILADRIIELISSPDELKKMKKANLDLSRQFLPALVADNQIKSIRSLGVL